MPVAYPLSGDGGRQCGGRARELTDRTWAELEPLLPKSGGGASRGPTTGASSTAFSGSRGPAPPGATQGDCRSCRRHRLSRVVDLSQLSTPNATEDADLDNDRKPRAGPAGRPVQEQVGERFRLNRVSGKIEPLAIMEGK